MLAAFVVSACFSAAHASYYGCTKRVAESGDGKKISSDAKKCLKNAYEKNALIDFAKENPNFMKAMWNKFCKVKVINRDSDEEETKAVAKDNVKDKDADEICDMVYFYWAKENKSE
jgi:hypothetical protein